jgi:hypothetical protein
MTFSVSAVSEMFVASANPTDEPAPATSVTSENINNNTTDWSRLRSIGGCIARAPIVFVSCFLSCTVFDDKAYLQYSMSGIAFVYPKNVGTMCELAEELSWLRSVRWAGDAERLLARSARPPLPMVVMAALVFVVRGCPQNPRPRQANHELYRR